MEEEKQIIQTDGEGNVLIYKAVKIAKPIGTGSYILLPKSLLGKYIVLEMEQPEGCKQQ